jgi:hypothetical protein
MRRTATFCFFALVAACATVPTAMSGIPGTYDLVSLGSQDLPTAGIQRLWMILTPQGTWEMHEEPGTRFGGTRGLYAMGDTLDACYRLSLWPESDPGARASMDFCPEETESIAYLVPAWLEDLTLDGPMVFRKRR